ILYQDGLIGRELHTTLKQELGEKRTRAEARPTLDLAVQKTILVSQFPLFGDMDEESRTKLARALKTRYVQPGDVLMRRGDVSREVCFISSGAVEVETAGQKNKLGRGEMFGQLSLLNHPTRRTQVTAISHSVLLVLDEARFRRLLDRNEMLRGAVAKGAERRGTPFEVLRS
ncbi:MAG: cyclic nucleotide-binding domain-containing protein, partial [Rhodospirillaceae bacterium]